MKRTMFLLCGLLLLSGCESIKGPWAHRSEPYQPGSSNLSIPEQEQRGRDRLATPDQSPEVGPRIDGFTLPGQQGR
jgi:hypothetical protein